MFRQSPRRYQRNNNGMKLKHLLRMSLVLGACIWLFVQVQRSGNRKGSSPEIPKTSEKAQYDTDSIKFGRKDLKPKTEVYSEDEKLTEVRPLETSSHFDDQTKPQNKLQGQHENHDVIQRAESYLTNVKDETETEEGAVAKEGHFEENEINENNYDVDGVKEHVGEDQIGNNEDILEGGGRDKATEEENSEHDSRIYGGESMDNEGTIVKAKRDTENYLEKGDVVGISNEKSKENTRENGNKENINEDNKTEGVMEATEAAVEKVGDVLRNKATEGVGFVENKIAQMRGGENEEDGKVSDGARPKFSGGDGLAEKKATQEKNETENVGIMGKVSEDALQKAVEAKEYIESMVRQGNSNSEEGKGKASQELTEKPLEDDGFTEKKVTEEMNNGDNDGKAKASNDLMQKSIEVEGLVENKVSEQMNNDDSRGKAKASTDSTQKSTEVEGITEKKVSEEMNNGLKEGNGKANADSSQDLIKDEGAMEKKVSQEMSKEQVVKQDDGLIEKLRLAEGKNNGETDEISNETKTKTREGEVVSDDPNLMSQNLEEMKKLSEERAAEKKQKAINRTKNSTETDQNEVPLSRENTFIDQSTEVGEQNSSNVKKSNSSLDLPSEEGKQDTVHENALNGNDNVQSVAANGQNVEPNTSQVNVDGNLNGSVDASTTEINTLEEHHAKPEEDKTNSYNDENDADNGQSSMDNLPQISDSSKEEEQGSSINESVDKAIDNEIDSSSSSLPQEEKDAATNLETLPESGTDVNNNHEDE